MRSALTLHPRFAAALVLALLSWTGCSTQPPLTSLGIGGEFICAIRSEGEVACQGNNAGDQLGDNKTEHRDCEPYVYGQQDCSPSAVKVVGVEDAVELAAGYGYACARLTGGQIACWGRDPSRYSAAFFASFPLTSIAVPDVVELAAGGEHFCVRQGSGKVLCWGKNDEGELGDATQLSRSSPAEVEGISDAQEIAAGGRHTCARRANGQVVCWGANAYGQLGDGVMEHDPSTEWMPDYSLVPVTVRDLTDAIALTAGDATTCALRANGQVACWGTDWLGMLGDGPVELDPERSSVPVLVAGLSDAKAVASGSGHTCALRATGAVVCWGDGSAGELGDGITARPCPNVNGVQNCSLSPITVKDLDDATELWSGGGNTCARRQTGEIVCWGINRASELGDWSRKDHFEPETLGGF